jgi:phage gp36-like protein
VTYALQADMVTAFGESELIELTDRAVPAVGAIDVAVLTRALAAADALANNYLAVRYTVPLSVVPAVLMEACCDIARYELTRGPGLRATEEIEKRYNQRVSWLRDLSAGKATLAEVADSAAPASAGLPEMTSGGRVFARETDYLD